MASPRVLQLHGLQEFHDSMYDHQLATHYAVPLEFAREIRVTRVSVIPAWWPVFQNVLSIGGKGSGKTKGAAYTIASLAMSLPGGLGVVVRKRHEQLRNTFLADFYDVLNEISRCTDPTCSRREEVLGTGKYRCAGHKDALIVHEGEKDGAVEVLIKTSGSLPCKIIFRIEPEGDDRTVADSFKSYNLNFALIEEASQLNFVTFDELRSRLRRSNSPVRRMFVLSNPTTESHWLAQYAAKCEQQALQYNPRLSEGPDNMMPEALVIRSKMTDNWRLPKDYVENEKRKYANDPVKYDMFINGLDGIDVDGQPVFSGHFDREHHVSTDVRFNTERPLIRGWDFGYQNPACVFMQTDDQGMCNVLAEYRAEKVYIEEFVDGVKAFTARHMPAAGTNGRQIHDFGDYAGTQQTDKEHTTIQRAQMRGVNILTRPNTKIESGLDVIRKLMAESRKLPSYSISAEKAELSRRRFRVHPRCKELVDALAYGYHYPKYKNGQVGTAPKKDDRYDHIVDALRYATINTFGLADDATSTQYKKVHAKSGKPLYRD
jgi:PBSX family phage terminase large subunit